MLVNRMICHGSLIKTNGKVKSFHCYTAGTIMLGQLGVLGNLGAAIHQ